MISLNYRDSRPIYEQIRESIKKLVVTGAVAPGDKLPSVRELASQLAINPNTIQRAYHELESEGYIVTIAGKGSFAAPGDENALRHKREVSERFLAAAAELAALGVTYDELAELIKGEVGNGRG